MRNHDEIEPWLSKFSGPSGGMDWMFLFSMFISIHVSWLFRSIKTRTINSFTNLTSVNYTVSTIKIHWIIFSYIYIYLYLYVNGSRKKTTSTNKHLQIDPQKSSILPAKVRPSDFTFGPRHRRPGRCGRRHPGAPRPRPAWWSPAHPWAPARCPEPLRSFGGNSENHGKIMGKP